MLPLIIKEKTMKYVLYKEIKFSNKTIKEFYVYHQGEKIVTTDDINKAKKFSSGYEASQVKDAETFCIGEAK